MISGLHISGIIVEISSGIIIRNCFRKYFRNYVRKSFQKASRIVARIVSGIIIQVSSENISTHSSSIAAVPHFSGKTQQSHAIAGYASRTDITREIMKFQVPKTMAVISESFRSATSAPFQLGDEFEDSFEVPLCRYLQDIPLGKFWRSFEHTVWTVNDVLSQSIALELSRSNTLLMGWINSIKRYGSTQF